MSCDQPKFFLPINYPLPFENQRHFVFEKYDKPSLIDYEYPSKSLVNESLSQNLIYWIVLALC